MEEYQIRKGNKIISRHKTKTEAGRALARQLFNHPKGLSVVRVIKRWE